jgi:transposase
MGMARKLPRLGEQLVREIEKQWAKPQEDWARKRLLVVRLIAQHEHTVAQIMKIAGVCRQTLFTYRDTLVNEGMGKLLGRRWAGARKPAVRGMLEEQFIERLKAGKFRQARDAQAWIKKRTRKTLSESGVRKLMRRLGGRLKAPRKSHAKKDAAKASEFKQELPGRLDELAGQALREGRRVRLWVLDEHRYGLLPVLRRVWGMAGVRVHAPYQTRYKWGYLHEALEVDGEHRSELLFTPHIDQDIHGIFLRQIGESDPQSLHVVIADEAGFHLKDNDGRIPENMRMVRLPPYSPELNPVERFGGLIKAAVGNRLYPTIEKLEAHIEAVARQWCAPGKVAGLIHEWLAAKANCGVPA